MDSSNSALNCVSANPVKVQSIDVGENQRSINSTSHLPISSTELSEGRDLEPLACTPSFSDALKPHEAENSRWLSKLLAAKGPPDRQSERAFQTYRLSDLGLERSQIAALLDRLVPLVTSSKNPADQKRHRDNLRAIIYALGAAGYGHEWLILPMQDKHYEASERLGKLGLSRRRVNRILNVLEEEGLLIRGRKGYRHIGSPSQSKASQFFPSPKLMELFASSLYDFEDDFDVAVYRYNDFPPGTEPCYADVAEGISLLQAYNEMMRRHSWARKGPTTRTFSESMHRGGRLNNGYQNIVKRRVPIRTNTFIDGQPLVEADFSANHLRMVAALNGIELPDDPYAVVAKRSRATREEVKAFATVALGAMTPSSIAAAMKSLRDNKRCPVRSNQFRAIRAAFETEYPWIVEKKVFFNDTGARMQVLEGNIAMRIFSQALPLDKPVLAVHDAFAVREVDADWILKAMEEAWMDELATTIVPVIRLD